MHTTCRRQATNKCIALCSLVTTVTWHPCMGNCNTLQGKIIVFLRSFSSNPGGVSKVLRDLVFMIGFAIRGNFTISRGSKRARQHASDRAKRTGTVRACTICSLVACILLWISFRGARSHVVTLVVAGGLKTRSSKTIGALSFPERAVGDWGPPRILGTTGSVRPLSKWAHQWAC